MAVTKLVNGITEHRMISIKKCWSNCQVFKQGCQEVAIVPDFTESEDLQKTVLKLEVMVDPVNVEDSHWIKISSSSKKIMVKL